MTSEQDIKKIKEMMEFLVRQKIAEKIKNLSADEKKVYNLTGRKRDIIQKETNFAAGKISGIWAKLESEGLLIKEGQSYRKVI